MSRRFYNLPPLTALAAFEAAARHLSFKRAAEELNVTPGAISHQIRGLEREIGTRLFNRVHRGVELTEDAEHLFRTLRGAFLDISNRTDALRNRTRRPGVTVGATTAMSALWLTPALSQFWREHPDVRVNQVVSDTLEFGAAKPELIINYGAIRDGTYDSTPLFRDTLVPVCAPSLAELHAPKSVVDLAGMPLIHLDAPDRRWTTWAAWFEEQGYAGPLRRGIVVNNYMIALQAAEDEAGMVLGWKRLVTPYLASGRLVAFDDFAIPAPTSFFLSRSAASKGDAGVDSLVERILKVAQSVEMNSS